MKYQVLVLLVAILLPNIGMGELTYTSDEDTYYNPEREGLNTGESMPTNEEQEIEYNAEDNEIPATEEPKAEELYYNEPAQSMDSVQLASESFQCTCTGKGGKTLGKSCQDIKKNFPNSKSGIYTLLVNGRLVRKYCVMETLCGSDAGWTRLVHFDAQIEKTCPNELKLVVTKQRIHCARKPSVRRSCASVPVPSDGIKYNKICGRVSGYQFYSTDGYRDGIAVTRGPLQALVWSFISGFSENHNHCPCSLNGHEPPSDIGEYNFCESGFRNWGYPNNHYKKYAIEDPLWDGKGCHGRETKCCNKEGQRKYMPFFLRETDVTSENLAVRICCDESTDNENVSIGSYEIYVQ
uniref:Apextrin C-terminal domain-containing protein n=1 Tax=Amphimedon queenslandica TaxID=400682 RepID=A0A1X7VFF1_AMPQE